MTTLLGNPTATANPSPVVETADAIERRQTRRRMAWIIRTVNRGLFPGTRWADCSNPLGRKVAVSTHPERNLAQISRIETCGSVWACLACAAKIRSKRADEVNHLATAHLAAGGGLTFITLTLPHEVTDTLPSLLGVMASAWELLSSGGNWRRYRQRHGVIGYIRALEFTHGASGWHPHLHVLVFHQRPVAPDDGTLQELRAYWANHWARFIRRDLGRQVHEIHGVDAVPILNHAGLGEYVSKIHLELTRQDLKTTQRRTSRTPWQIAADAHELGDAQDAAIWAEFTKSTKGRRMLTVSPALRKTYGTHASADKTDAELAAETQDGVLRFFIDARLWHRARAVRRRTLIADALDAYEAHGTVAAVVDALADAGPIVLEPTEDGVPLLRLHPDHAGQSTPGEVVVQDLGDPDDYRRHAPAIADRIRQLGNELDRQLRRQARTAAPERATQLAIWPASTGRQPARRTTALDRLN